MNNLDYEFLISEVKKANPKDLIMLHCAVNRTITDNNIKLNDDSPTWKIIDVMSSLDKDMEKIVFMPSEGAESATITLSGLRAIELLLKTA